MKIQRLKDEFGYDISKALTVCLNLGTALARDGVDSSVEMHKNG